MDRETEKWAWWPFEWHMTCEGRTSFRGFYRRVQCYQSFKYKTNDFIVYYQCTKMHQNAPMQQLVHYLDKCLVNRASMQQFLYNFAFKLSILFFRKNAQTTLESYKLWLVMMTIIQTQLITMVDWKTTEK